MLIQSVNSKAFQKYGQVLDDFDFSDFVEVLKRETPMPEKGFTYQASHPNLESHPVFSELRERVYGGMAIQLGYCNGHNTVLNCLEYHKGSEVCIMAYDTILMLGLRSDIEDWKYDTRKIEAFMVPAGTGVELYSTTLHYAPCHVAGTPGYKVANGLPLGTNADMCVTPKGAEDKLLLAVNKWLLAHPDAPEAENGAYIGLAGENIDIRNEIG